MNKNHKSLKQQSFKTNQKVVASKYVEIEDIPDDIKQKYFYKPPFYNFI